MERKRAWITAGVVAVTFTASALAVMANTGLLAISPSARAVGHLPRSDITVTRPQTGDRNLADHNVANKAANNAVNMTTEHDVKPVVARKRRRPHPARNARLMTAGAAAGLTFGVVAALVAGDASTAFRASADLAVEQATPALVPVNASLTPTMPRVTVLRRIHDLPTVATVAPPPQATAGPVVFTPQPAIRVDVKSVALPRKRSVAGKVVRRAVTTKRRVPTRRARRATRAS